MNTISRFLFATIIAAPFLISCDDNPRSQSSDEIDRQKQELVLKQGSATVGIPAITHFREKKLLKTILELRDQEDLSTFTYTWSDVKGEAKFFCNSIGFGIPYATQFTSPQKADTYEWNIVEGGHRYAVVTVPQADPA